MRRRGFLGLLASAPFTAEAAAQSMGGSAVASGVGAVEPWEGTEVLEVDPIKHSARRFLQKARSKAERKLNTSINYMPSYISERKSWSSAFKNHCYRQDVDALPPEYYGMEWDELIAAALKHGWTKP